MEKMYARYKERVEFLGIYIREAHPTDGWRLSSNDRVGITIAQPRTIEERVGVAAQCSEALEVSMPLLVDHIDNSVEQTYSAFPDRLYLIDEQGKVAFKSGRGPYGFEPRELERTLVMMMLERDKLAPPEPEKSAEPEEKEEAAGDDKPDDATKDGDPQAKPTDSDRESPEPEQPAEPEAAPADTSARE